MSTAFVIDDTGSPGQQNSSKYLRGDRKSWVGVLFNEEERKEAENEMEQCLAFVKKEFQINEFHFTDIYGNDKLDINLRLNIFRAFSKIYSMYKWPIIVQTFNPDSLLEHGYFINEKKTIDGFDLKDHSDFALYFLLFRFKNFIYKNTDKYSIPVDIIIDEGRRKANSSQDIKLLEGIASGNKLYYKSSAEQVLLQIADFAAYCFNRTQWLLTKSDRTKADVEFLRLVKTADFNYINLEKVSVDLNTFSSEDYDYYQSLDKANKNLLPLSKVNYLKDTIK